jgi:ATP-binding cassette subfamily C protein LapB
MQLKTDIDDTENYLHRPELQGNVEFRQVEFNYADEKVAALKLVSFKIRSGEKVAIIGRVGSGKSTIARLILRLYEPTKGNIFLDDTDYRQINPDDLRQQIGYVPQDITLFYGSLKDNITIGAPFVTDKELITAAEVAGVQQFTKHHPDGFDRQVGEKGHALSGGQRQSVALARALLLHPHLLLLDEPTSAMDDSNERLIKQNLKNYLGPEDTLILITHKMSMLELVDRIIVMDDGKVFADGNKESVLNMLRASSSKTGVKDQS